MLPVRQIRIVAVPLMTDVPANTALDAPARIFAPGRRSPALFFGGIGLAGQQRLVDVEIAAFEQPRSAGTRSPAISWTMSPGTSRASGTETTRRRAARCLHRDRLAQRLDRILGPDFLNEIEEDADQHDADDDDEAGDIAGRGGYRAGDQQDDDQRVAKAGGKL